MATFHGTAGNNTFAGTTGDDIFRLFQGGEDTATGDNGNDLFRMDGALDAGDSLDGGAGTDQVNLQGDYSGGLTFGATTITNVEVLRMSGAFDYDLTMDDGNVGAGQHLKINAEQIAAGHHLTFDGSAEANGRFRVFDSAGDDTITGGRRGDAFHMERGGEDTIYGGAGIDRFYFGGALSNGDTVYGGHGDDALFVDGDYAAAVTLTIFGIETMSFGAGHVYNFALQDGAVPAFNSLYVDASALTGASDGLSFDASHLTQGNVDITASGGDDVLKGGAGSDLFDLTANPGGEDTVNGGAGDDYFEIGSGLDAGDKIDGGTGSGDAMQIDGDYSAGVTFAADTITNIYSIAIVDDFLSSLSYKFITNDGNVAAGATLGVYGFQIPGSASLYWDGSAETNGSFDLHGGAGADTLIGGAHADTIAGGTGNNTMKGGGGADDITCQVDTDTLQYDASSDSASVHYDTVHGFDADHDQFNLFFSVSSIDAQSFSVDSSTFDANMGTHLSDYLCTVVTASGGDLIGHKFLVINADTGDGFNYEAGVDLVIDITGYAGTLDTSDFI